MKNEVEMYNGDCLDVMDKLIADEIIVDAIITDIPYGTTACKWDTIIPFEEMWPRLNRLIKPNGAIVLFGSEPFSSALRVSNLKNYKYDWIWEKSRPANFMNAKFQPLKSHEIITVFSNSKHNYYPIRVKGEKNHATTIRKSSAKSIYSEKQKVQPPCTSDMKYPKSILKIKSEDSTRNLHPTQKPIALMEYLIKTYTNECELVLDFTMGSGSTLVACKNTNRRGIGIEMDKGYFDIASKRVNEIQGSLF